MPHRHHIDWRYVNHTLEQNLPSFVHFYRLWIFPRAMRSFKLPRFFQKPREVPLPDMHLLGWKDVAWRIFQFLKLGLCGWWDERTLVDMKISHIEQQLSLRDILKETSSCPREYFRDLLCSVMIPRATLLRFIPQLTPVAFFIQQMASTPLYMAPWPLPPPSESEPPIPSTDIQDTLRGCCERLSSAFKHTTPAPSVEPRIDPQEPTTVALSPAAIPPALVPPAVIPSLETSTGHGPESTEQGSPDVIPIDKSLALSLPPPLPASIDGNVVLSEPDGAIIGEELQGTLPTSGFNIRPKPASTLLKATTATRLPKLHLPMNMHMRLSLPSSLSRVPLAPINDSSNQIQPEPQPQPSESQPALSQPEPQPQPSESQSVPSQPAPPQLQPLNPISHPTPPNKIMLPPIQPSNNLSAPPPSSTPVVSAELQNIISAAARKRREKRMKKKGNHREQLRVLEEQLKIHDEENLQYWPIYVAAPYKFLHCCSLFPICYQGRTFAGPTWMWFMNLGQFALGLWLAFSHSVGSVMLDPALRGGIVFLTYAVILPSALSIALRASIPLGRFIGVEDADFIPFKDFFSLFKPSTWDDFANDDKSSIGDLSSYASSVASDGDMDMGYTAGHGIGSDAPDVENFLYGTHGRHGSSDLLNRAAAMMLDDDDDNDNGDDNDNDDNNDDNNEREDVFGDVEGDGMNHQREGRGHEIPINPW